MYADQMRGIFTIPSTPFHEDGSIDIDGFRNIVRFCIDCGAHGLVYPVNASEFTKLSDIERNTLVKEMIEVAEDRVPTVVGVASTSKENAMKFTRFAREVGATAVIAMPPYVRTRPLSEAVIFDYYKGISDAGKIPVYIQNYVPPVGTDMSVEFLLKLCHEIEYVDYIKEETIPSTLKLTQLLNKHEDACKGVFGGSGCRYIIEEYLRGSCGNMPGCHITDVCVNLWIALESGNNAYAMQIYQDMAPLFFFETQIPSMYKEVLKYRGIISCAFTRNGYTPLDAVSSQYLKDVLAKLEPHMTYGK